MLFGGDAPGAMSRKAQMPPRAWDHWAGTPRLADTPRHPTSAGAVSLWLPGPWCPVGAGPRARPWADQQLRYSRGGGGGLGAGGQVTRPLLFTVLSFTALVKRELGGRCERGLCLCIQAFQGSLQKVGAPGALKGLFVTGSLAWGAGGRKGSRAGAAARVLSVCAFRRLWAAP